MEKTKLDTPEGKRRTELRRIGQADIPAAISQCGISVHYLMSGPREMFDVADVLLDSEFVRQIKADARKEALREAANELDGISLLWFERSTIPRAELIEWLRALAEGGAR